ncbi:MAG TPA: bifunctional phosphoribosylaminoimidazolecarboxamide formyltransferase/IMP cyclohydrolase [Rhabdochlamydiaceae bacterium]|nr:bifunctional phosphoribosylaminoimidazolecarboxamide formyltransferase/IMP cyclohydrolase [Rhabdochlamydiaceae bacterium]
MKKIQTVLVSVTDKTHLSFFLKGLLAINPSINLIASGGTAEELKKFEIPFTLLSDYTKSPECFGGRVKTLHPKIMGGILYRRGVHEEEAKKLGIEGIDLVICNLYDFEKAALNPENRLEDVVEKIDIGGSTLLRSACKNFSDVAVVVDPGDYESLLKELVSLEGSLSLETRKSLAVKAIQLSAAYESVLASELSKRMKSEKMHFIQLNKGQELRYGENPDQKGWIYEFANAGGLAQAKILSGKQISFNNYEDATLAYYSSQELISLGSNYGVSIVKHGSLCGYATGQNELQALERAWECDSKSAFGSVIGLSFECSSQLIPFLTKKFIEVIVAPKFESAFIQWAEKVKPNLRLLELGKKREDLFIFKSISGGMLVQTRKQNPTRSLAELFMPSLSSETSPRGIMTKKAPLPEQLNLFGFAILAVNFLKSNAIAIVREYAPGSYQMIGSGSGQPNRIDCLERLALPKTIDNLRAENLNVASYDPKKDLSTCVLASDGFFPFADSINSAASQGIKYCIQPGGSNNDLSVIQAADAQEMCMIFTGQRYFYH